MLRRLALLLVLSLCVFSVGTAHAQATVTVDGTAMNLGFMNVFNLPAPAGDGAFQFGSGWGIVDLTAVFAGNVVTLGPNTIGDPNEYWYQCVGGAVPPNCGGPGAPGNKIMEANLYSEDPSLNGQLVTFSGEVISNTLTSAHTVVAFIKDFAPDYSSFVQNTVPVSAVGPFNVSLATINDPNRHVQYGFQMTGVNVWSTDVGPFGTIVLGPTMAVPTETTTWSRVKALF